MSSLVCSRHEQEMCQTGSPTLLLWFGVRDAKPAAEPGGTSTGMQGGAGDSLLRGLGGGPGCSLASRRLFLKS